MKRDSNERKQKMEKVRKFAGVGAHLEARSAKRFIRKFRVKKGQKFVLWCRVSGMSQCRNMNLKDQEELMRRRVEERGGIVVAVFIYVGSGYGHESFEKLQEAAKYAKEHGAVLLAETTDRFVRNPAYHSKKNPRAQARTVDLEKLLSYTKGTPLMTLLDPEKAYKARSRQTRRGKSAKQNSRGSGREAGWKKRRKLKLRPRAIKLHLLGYSLGGIGEELNTPKGTIQTWINWYKSSTPFRKVLY